MVSLAWRGHSMPWRTIARPVSRQQGSMHKVCDIRDLGLRASLPPRRMWAAYVRDLEALMERSLDGFPASAPGYARLREAA